MSSNDESCNTRNYSQKPPSHNSLLFRYVYYKVCIEKKCMLETILSEYFCSSEQLKALATVNSKIFGTLLSSNICICITYKTIGSIMKTHVCIFLQCRLNINFLLTQILYPKLNVQHSMK